MNHLLALVLTSTIIQIALHPNNKISADDIVQTLYQHSECSDPGMKLDAAHAITIDHLEYDDFLEDGNEEAIVVA